MLAMVVVVTGVTCIFKVRSRAVVRRPPYSKFSENPKTHDPSESRTGLTHRRTLFALALCLKRATCQRIQSLRIPNYSIYKFHSFHSNFFMGMADSNGTSATPSDAAEGANGVTAIPKVKTQKERMVLFLEL